jgi:hypothetical protein
MTEVSLTPPPAARPHPLSLTSPPSPTSPTSPPRVARVAPVLPAYPSALCSWLDDCDYCEFPRPCRAIITASYLILDLLNVSVLCCVNYFLFRLAVVGLLDNLWSGWGIKFFLVRLAGLGLGF